MRPFADALQEDLGTKGNGKAKRRLEAMTKAHHTIVRSDHTDETRLLSKS